MCPLIQRKLHVFLYIDELACSPATFQRRRINMSPRDLFNENPSDYVSVLIAATNWGILTHSVKRGFYTTQDFQAALKESLEMITAKLASDEKFKDHKVLVITDLHKIHLDHFSVPKDQRPIKAILDHFHVKRYLIPPSSPHFNPIESMFSNIKSKLFKKEIIGPAQL